MRHPSMELPYVLLREGPKERDAVLYGPLSEGDALRGMYFSIYVERRDEIARKGDHFRLFEIQWFSDNDIHNLGAFPQESGFDSVTVIPSQPRIHESWLNVSPGFREEMFQSDLHYYKVRIARSRS